MAAHIPDQFKPENVVAIHLSSDFGRAAKELYIGALFAEYENLEAVHAGGIEYRQKELLYSHAEVSEIAERLQTENRADILAELDMDDEKLTALLNAF